MVLENNNNDLVSSHRYKHVVARCRGLAIGAAYIRVLMQKKKTAVKEHMWIYQISSGATLQLPLEGFGAIPPAARFCFPFAFATLPAHSICYLVRQHKIALAASVASPRDTTFAILIGGTYYFVSWRVFWPNVLCVGYDHSDSRMNQPSTWNSHSCRPSLTILGTTISHADEDSCWSYSCTSSSVTAANGGWQI